MGLPKDKLEMAVNPNTTMLLSNNVHITDSGTNLAGGGRLSKSSSINRQQTVATGGSAAPPPPPFIGLIGCGGEGADSALIVGAAAGTASALALVA
jgi:hypothetical protein